MFQETREALWNISCAVFKSRSRRRGAKTVAKWGLHTREHANLCVLLSAGYTSALLGGQDPQKGCNKLAKREVLRIQGLRPMEAVACM